MAHKASQKPASAGKLQRRDFIKATAGALVAVTTAAAAPRLAQAHTPDAALETARAIDALCGVAPHDLIPTTFVDTIHAASDALDLPHPDGWLMADRRGEGVEELAAWLRRVPVTFSLREQADPDPYQLTAERIAALMEAPETPPVVVSLLQSACSAIDGSAAEQIDDETYDFKFGRDIDITADDVREHLAGQMRKVADWWSPYAVELEPLDDEGGES